MSSDPRWSRPYFEATGARARINIVAFGNQLPAAGVEPSKEDGWPEAADWPDTLPVRPFDLADPEQQNLFHACLHGPIRDRADDVLGPAAAKLEEARFAFAIDGEIEEPRSLEHLQCLHAMLRLLARSAGVFAALNYESVEWIDVGELARSPLRSFDVLDWIGMVLATEPDPDFGRILHSRGMVQFGRPDLVILGFDEVMLDAAGRSILEVVKKLALGTALRSGDRLLVAREASEDGEVTRIEADTEALRPGGNGPDVGLDKETMVLRMTHDALGRLQRTLED